MDISETNDFFDDYGNHPGIATNGTIYAAGTYMEALFMLSVLMGPKGGS